MKIYYFNAKKTNINSKKVKKVITGLNRNTRIFIRVFIVPCRLCLNLLLRRKTEEWMIGFASGNNVVVLNPQKWKYIDKASIDSIIIHEIVHILINDEKKNCPQWLNEGMAMLVSEQLYDHDDTSVSNPYKLEYGKENFYYEVNGIMNKLVEIYGKRKIIRHFFAVNDYKNDTIFGMNNVEHIIGCNIYEEKSY